MLLATTALLVLRLSPLAAVAPLPQDTGRQEGVVSKQVLRERREGPRRDSAARERRRASAGPANRRPGPATDEQVESAFRSGRARQLVERARAARRAVDSTLWGYDATVQQRASAGLNFTSFGRERLAIRTETAARVRWSRGSGVLIDVLGTRTAMPIAFPRAQTMTMFLEATPVPYYPGRDGLYWFIPSQAYEDDDPETADVLFVHPLDEGAEAFYEYSAGDSMRITLPNGRPVRLMEVTVRARRPSWQLIVGSLWLDAATGQLVRAAYRPSAPFDVLAHIRRSEPEDYDDIPRAARALMSPTVLEIESFTVEYALHHGQWWLPRVQTVQATMRVGVARAPATMRESFEYASVSGRMGDSVSTSPAADSVGDITRARGGRRLERSDDIGTLIQASIDPFVPGTQMGGRGGGRSPFARCQAGDTLVSRRFSEIRGTRVTLRVPCDSAGLANSPALPASIFAPDETLFGAREAQDLAKSLTFALQPVAGDSGAARYALHYGLDRGLVRYNRVEGLSAGVQVERPIAGGYAATGTLRLGTADVWPNVEVAVSRSAGSRSMGVAAYRRLAASNDWGAPLGVGASLNAALFGHDDGFYYRAWGLEATGQFPNGAGGLTWRAFMEEQRAARVKSQFSLPYLINAVRFIDNIDASEETLLGGAGRLRSTFGTDPHGFRLATDARAELATGSVSYGRAALDATVTHGLGRYLDGALTLAGGSTAGEVPVQRFWFLGGSQTVRGQPAGAQAGNAFWLARAELGRSTLALRPVVFADFGWAGEREHFARPGRPLSGAGVGASFWDGLIRADLAKGITPRRGLRADLYLEARF